MEGEEKIMSKCKSCGAEIVWHKTKNGKNIPLDREMKDGAGNVWISTSTADHVVVSDTCPGPKDEFLGPYLSHFATCPNASAHRKAR